MTGELARFFKRNGGLVEKELIRLLHPWDSQADTIRRAMLYSLLAGGKRLRPILVMAAAECLRTKPARVLQAAAGMEMIHTYSLIHDDLPAMDDDDLRRGKPTNHKVFGEAMAILAGDGLLTKAFEVVAENARRNRLGARATAELISALARGAGCSGMVGGQAADLEAENLLNGNGTNGIKQKKRRGYSSRALRVRLEYIHLHKTAALIATSLELGAILSGGSPRQRKNLRAYGLAVGLAFQIADDVLDVTGDKTRLGKNGSDKDNGKLTYAALYGIEAARKKARLLAHEAHRHLRVFGPRARLLHELADYIIAREN